MYEDPFADPWRAQTRRDVILVVAMGVLAIAAIVGLQWIADTFG